MTLESGGLQRNLGGERGRIGEKENRGVGAPRSTWMEREGGPRVRKVEEKLGTSKRVLSVGFEVGVTGSGKKMGLKTAPLGRCRLIAPPCLPCWRGGFVAWRGSVSRVCFSGAGSGARGEWAVAPAEARLSPPPLEPGRRAAHRLSGKDTDPRPTRADRGGFSPARASGSLLGAREGAGRRGAETGHPRGSWHRGWSSRGRNALGEAPSEPEPGVWVRSEEGRDFSATRASRRT